MPPVTRASKRQRSQSASSDLLTPRTSLPPVCCVGCGVSVPYLYREYSHDSIRLARCPSCNAVTDKYIEYELTLVVLDMTLHDLSAYRHLLFNRKPFANPKSSSLVRIALSLLVLDIHLRYALYVHTSSSSPSPTLVLDDTPAYQLRLLLHLAMSTIIELVTYHLLIYVMGLFLVGGHVNKRKMVQALLYPNFGRLMALFVMIWERSVVVVNFITLLITTSQYLALQAVLTTPPPPAPGLAPPPLVLLRAALPLVVSLAVKTLLIKPYLYSAFHPPDVCLSLL